MKYLVMILMVVSMNVNAMTVNDLKTMGNLTNSAGQQCRSDYDCDYGQKCNKSGRRYSKGVCF